MLKLKMAMLIGLFSVIAHEASACSANDIKVKTINLLRGELVDERSLDVSYHNTFVGVAKSNKGFEATYTFQMKGDQIAIEDAPILIVGVIQFDTNCKRSGDLKVKRLDPVSF